ncbi:MAG TPA: glycine betaine ABC transporter substrate-binding protein [Nitrospiraceae bacterium]|nr:glycine betaine ABC transporter substrate-binding protein [Nitrospiraceae bacterium]
MTEWQRLPLHVVFLFTVAVMFTSCDAEHTVVIGSKNFTEQLILGELLAQQIEARTDLRVKRQFNLGGTFVCHQALVSGKIDAYVEYTGTALTAILHEPPSRDPEATYRTVQDAYRRRFNIEWLPPLGFANTFAIMIRTEDAKRLGIRTLSQLAEQAPRWHAAFGYEFLERADGFTGLAKTYGLRFAEPPRVMDLALTYQALADRKADVIAGDSTNGLIIALGLTVLEDDQHYFSAYQAAPVVSAKADSKLSTLHVALSALTGVVTDHDMRRLNYEVDGKRRDIAKVVKEFRQEKRL